MNIQFHWRKKREYKDELLKLDVYLNPDEECDDGIAKILGEDTLTYIHLIKQNVFDDIIVPILEDEDQFSLFMFSHVTFHDDDECIERFNELNDLFIPGEKYVLPRYKYKE